MTRWAWSVRGLRSEVLGCLDGPQPVGVGDAAAKGGFSGWRMEMFSISAR